MLPPVAAVSDTFLGQFNQPQNPSSSTRIQIGPIAQPAPVPSGGSPSALAGDRLTILSLSGQMQLAQGLSLVAETVGAVLKVARHDGEPLSDYADRLADVIANLSAAERASLQRALTQMVKGLTIRLLAEILKNPVGPEATRLSLQLETRAATDRDPVARGVVTSYRQNDSSGMPAGPTRRPAAVVGGQAMGVAAPTAPQAPSSAIKAGLTWEGSNPVAAASSGNREPSGRLVLPELHALHEPFLPDTKGSVDRSRSPASTTTTAPFASLAAGSDAFIAGDPSPAGMPSSIAASANDEAVQGPSSPSHRADAESTGAPRIATLSQSLPEADGPSKGNDGVSAPIAKPSSARSEVDQSDEIIYDGMALARDRSAVPSAVQAAAVLARGPQAPLSVAARLSGDGLAAAILGTGWLASFYNDETDESVLDTGSRPQARPSTDAAGAPNAAPSATQRDAGVPGSPPVKANAASPHVSDQQPTSVEPLVPAGGEPMDLGETAADLQLAAVNQAALLARAIPREAIVPVYVPYPPQSDGDDADGSAVRAVEAVDEDGSRGGNGGEPGDEPQDGPEGDEASPENEPALSASAEPGPDAAVADDAGDSDAHGYYLRMAAW